MKNHLKIYGEKVNKGKGKFSDSSKSFEMKFVKVSFKVLQ